jgi:hypothetical protein
VIAEALEQPALKHGAKAVARALARSDGALAVAEQLELLASEWVATAPTSTSE